MRFRSLPLSGSIYSSGPDSLTDFVCRSRWNCRRNVSVEILRPTLRAQTSRVLTGSEVSGRHPEAGYLPHISVCTVCLSHVKAETRQDAQRLLTFGDLCVTHIFWHRKQYFRSKLIHSLVTWCVCKSRFLFLLFLYIVIVRRAVNQAKWMKVQLYNHYKNKVCIDFRDEDFCLSSICLQWL